MADFLTALNKNGSGLNLRDLAGALVQADVVPRKRAEQGRIDKADTSLSALGRLRAQMQQLSGAMQAVAQTPVLRATSSAAAVAVTVRDAALVGSVTRSIGVVQTAQRQVLEFAGHAAPDAVLGGGVLTVDRGIWTTDAESGLPAFARRPDAEPQTITLPQDATLTDLAAALDALDGVTAAVLDKGDGTFSLGVVSETGAGAALRFGAAGGLAGFDTQAGPAGAQVAAARDAVLTVDGITVLRPENSIDDLIPGARLDITATTGTPATVSLTRDAAVARDSLGFLVDQVNTTRALLNDLGARGLNGADPGALAGDRVIAALKAQLDRLVSDPVAGFATAGARLSDFGVETQRDGTLRLNAARFDAAFARDPARIDMLFTDRITASQPGVRVSGTPPREAEARSYRFERDAAGRATLDGTTVFGLAMGDGTRKYIAPAGGLAGTVLTIPDGVDSALIHLGRSLASALDGLALAATGAGGAIAKREDVLARTRSDGAAKLAALDVRSAGLERRYLSRFAAMEQAVTSLKGTGAYLTNLVAAWNKDG